MRKVVICLSVLMSLLMLFQVTGSVLAEEEENHETHEGADDMSLCLSAVFLLVIVFIVIAAIVLGLSRRAKKV